MNIIENLDTKLNLEKLYQYIDEVLTKREKEIIIKRFGLCGLEPLTQREIAKELKISRSYVSRIEKKALSQLRKKYEGY